jgi:LysM repeat protein
MMPKRRLRVILVSGLVLALTLLACALPGQSPTPTAILVATEEERPTSPPSDTSALVSEVVNLVEARSAEANDFAKVNDGYALDLGGQLRTGDESTARLDLTGGAILRLGSNSLFTVEDVAVDNALVRLQLAFGKLWVSLAGGELEVATPVGSASVRGSFGVIEYDKLLDVLTLKCLEGKCVFENENFSQQLGNLQQVQLTNRGQGLVLTPLTLDDVQEYLDANPDQGPALLATLLAAPTATRSPETLVPTSPTRTFIPVNTDTPAPPPPLPTATLAPVTAPPPVPILGRHTLRPGETLFCIGRAYGVLPNAIAQANGIGAGGSLRAGQTITIPAVQWRNIPPGPVCPPQFRSPFPGLPLTVNTVTSAATVILVTATPSITVAPPTPFCKPPEYFDPFLNRCRRPEDNTPYAGFSLNDSPLYNALARNQRPAPTGVVSGILALAGVALGVLFGSRRQ